MLKKRIIPSLLIENRKLVKTKNFQNARYVGDPLNAIKIFNEKFVDELIILDITKNNNNGSIDYDYLKIIFGECFVPVTYGGGISNLNQADMIFKLGVEKISLNTAVLQNRDIIREFSNNFGSQSIVISIDVTKSKSNEFVIFNHKKIEKQENLNLIEYIRELEELGAGEIFINSVNKDGTMRGMDLELIEKTSNLNKLPIVYCGGIGSVNDIRDAFKFNISGVSAGSFFVFYGPFNAVLISYPHEEFEKL